MNFFSYSLKKVTCTDKVKGYFLFSFLNAESSSCNQLLCILVEFSLISTNKSNTALKCLLIYALTYIHNKEKITNNFYLSYLIFYLKLFSDACLISWAISCNTLRFLCKVRKTLWFRRSLEFLVQRQIYRHVLFLSNVNLKKYCNF